MLNTVSAFRMNSEPKLLHLSAGKRIYILVHGVTDLIDNKSTFMTIKKQRLHEIIKHVWAKPISINSHIFSCYCEYSISISMP
jgi:hypothetical protein